MSTRIAFALSFLLAATATVSPARAQQFVISTYAGGAPPSTPSAAANTAIGYATAVTTDGAGNVYFVSSLNCVFRVNPNGILTRIAGNSRPGYSGDGGPAIGAQLFLADDPENGNFGYPGGLAIDRLGNLYITDAGNRRIRKVSPAGIISTVAGNGTIGYSGDGGPAILAQLNAPTGLAVDSAGNLFIADGPRIRKISPDGVITTAAEGFGWAVAVDSAGNLYIAGSQIVRKLSPDGAITTVAGSGSPSNSGDGGPATSAQFFGPSAVALDNAGNLYIGDQSRVRMVSADGIIRTVAGGGSDDPGDGGPATSARIDAQGIAVGISGNLYIAGYNRVHKVSPNGVIATLAGDDNVPYYSGDGGPAAKAQLNQPHGVALDGAGNLYVADSANSRIRRVSPDGIITTVAGNGGLGYSGDGGPAIQAQIGYPIGLAVDKVGNLYIGEGSTRVRKVQPNGVITTVAGNGTWGYSGDGGPAISAQLSVPSGLTVDTAGNLFILDTENNRVRMVSPDGIITTVAGTGIAGYSGDGGPATGAQLGITRQIHGINPTGLAMDGAGNLYIADDGNLRVRKVSPSGIISTVAGSRISLGYSGDGGPATSAEMSFPYALAADRTGNLYIAESSHVRKVSPDGIITTIAGNLFGYSGDGGPAPAGQMGLPNGLAVDSLGNVYVADRYYNVVRVLQPISGSLLVTGIANGASYLGGPVSPGEIVVITGAGLGPAQLKSAAPAADGEYPTEVSGTMVYFNGTPAPVVYTSATRVAVQVPASISLDGAMVAVTYGGQVSTLFRTDVVPYAPGIFTLDSTGKGQVLSLNQDDSLSTATTPPRIGELISLYVTGVRPGEPLFVRIDDRQAIAGPGVNVLPGVMRFAVRIPAGVRTGSAVPVVVIAGDPNPPDSRPSQPGATLVVQAGSSAWMSIGPEGGAIKALSVDPHHPGTLYAATWYGGGGPFKSTGGSDRWVKSGVPNTPLIFDPRDPGTIYTFDYGPGIYKSTDGGTSWNPANSGLYALVLALTIDPVKPSTLYAGTAAGIFKSTDGGNHWSPASSGLPLYTGGGPTRPAGVSSVVVDPQSPSTLYAEADGNASLSGAGLTILTVGALVKSTDGGGSWNILDLGLPHSHIQHKVLAIDPQHPSTLYVGTEYGIFKSTDGGAGWSPVNSGLPPFATGLPPFPDGSPYFVGDAAAIDPRQPETVYVAITSYSLSSKIFKTTNGGAIWSAAGSGPPEGTVVYSLRIDPRTPATLYAGTSVGVFRSTDGGTSWTAANSGLTGITITDVAIDPRNANTLYAATTIGLFKTIDRGTNWSPPIPNVGRGFGLAIDLQDSSTVFAPGCTAPPSAVRGCGIFKSTDGGTSWSASWISPEAGAGVVGLAIDQRNSNIVYAITVGIECGGESLHKSVDGGMSWSHSLFKDMGVVASCALDLAVDPRNPAHMYAAFQYGGVFKSTDAGATWKAANSGLTPANSFSGRTAGALAIDPGNPSTVYTVSSAGAFKSLDGGMSWNTANSGLPDWSRELEDCCFFRPRLAVDPQNPARVYLGITLGVGVVDHVFQSSDGGASWTGSLVMSGAGGGFGGLAISSQGPSTVYAGGRQGLFAMTLPPK